MQDFKFESSMTGRVEVGFCESGRWRDKRRVSLQKAEKLINDTIHLNGCVTAFSITKNGRTEIYIIKDGGWDFGIAYEIPASLKKVGDPPLVRLYFICSDFIDNQTEEGMQKFFSEISGLRKEIGCPDATFALTGHSSSVGRN